MHTACAEPSGLTLKEDKIKYKLKQLIAQRCDSSYEEKI